MLYVQDPKEILAFVERLRADAEAYHDQKDKMAYAVGALMVAFGAAYLAGNQPSPIVLTHKALLLGFIFGLLWLWGCAHFILCFQLKSKRIAAIRSLAYNYALLDAYTGASPISFEQKTMADLRTDSTPLKNIWYTMLLHPSAFGLSDISMTSGPTFLIEAFERAVEHNTHSTYVERATWLLSVLVLAILIGKTIAKFAIFQP